jgi:hypothetical protein
MMAEEGRPTLAALELGDPPERWEALGFTVIGGSIELAGVRLALGAPEPGIQRWQLTGIVSTDDIDGLPTTVLEPREPAPTEHPNGAVGLDHVVVTTPNFDRTAATLEAHGMPLRRIRDAGGFRQGFRRLGPGILELVEAPQLPPGPARFWGLVVVVRDLGWLTSQLVAGWVGEPKAAVQPGRRITTLSRAAGLGQPVAFITPEPA